MFTNQIGGRSWTSIKVVSVNLFIALLIPAIASAQTRLRQLSPPSTTTPPQTVNPLDAMKAWRTITQDVVYGHKFGMALTYDVIQPTEGANGAGILFMWSGGWVSRFAPPSTIVRESRPDQPNVWEEIVSAGYTLYVVRHGSSPKFNVLDAVDDVRLALHHIRAHATDYSVDPDRLGVCGGSAGGHLSLMLGTTSEVPASGVRETTTNRVAAVVAYFPPTDLVPYVAEESPYRKQFPALQITAEEAVGVSPLKHVSKDDAPTLLVHGDQDELVTLSHSEEIAEAFLAANVPHDLIVIEGAAHGFTGAAGERANQALIEWFNRYLNQPSTPSSKRDE